MAKILVIRFSSIGDIVLTTPVVRMLAKSGHEVFYLTKARYTNLLENNPYIKKVYAFDASLPEVIASIRKDDMDYIVDLHRNLRTMRVKLALRKPGRSFRKLNFAKWLMVNFNIDILPSKHIVDRYLDAARKYIDFNDDEGLDYFNGYQTLPQVFLSEKLKPESYVVLAVGGQHATKRMPIGKLMEICDKLMFPVVLVGGKEDMETGFQLSKLSVNKVLDLCGQVSVNESAEIIRHCAAIITHDTGMMHIAAAMRKNIVSVWGNTIPAFGMTPYLPGEYSQRSIIVENRDLRCRPCSKIGFDHCPKNHFQCMEQLDTDDIVASVQDLIVG